MAQPRLEFPPPMLSIIIPTRESERTLVRTLAVLVAGAAAGVVREVIVTDPRSTDATADIADIAGCQIIVSGAPLGARLRDAANGARARWLMFMRPGTVLVDVAVDQGGCIETCKPTTHENPTYIIDDVVHYCVANMPGAVARTATFALANVTLPYALSLANKGLRQALAGDAMEWLEVRRERPPADTPSHCGRVGSAPGGLPDAPAVYAVNGKEFVVIAAGGGKWGAGSGGTYVAFALP